MIDISSNLEFLPLAIIIFSCIISLILHESYVKNFCLFALVSSLGLLIMLFFKIDNHTSYVFGGFSPSIGIEHKINHLNLIIVTLIIFISINSLIIYKGKQENFYCFFMAAISGLCGMCFSNDIFNIYVFMEVASISCYILVACEQNLKAYNSSLNYLIVGTIATSFILLAIGLIYVQTGTLNINDISKILKNQESNILSLCSYILLILGLLIKIGAAPFHSWLLDTYNSIETSLKIFFAGCTNKVYLYLIFKLISVFQLNKIEYIYLEYISLFGIMLSNIIASRSFKSNNLLIYSSISQLSYISLLISLEGILEKFQAIFVIAIINHSLAKANLFSIYDNKYKNKLSKFLVLFNLASLLGLPFSLGFIFKWELLSILIKKSGYLSFTVIIFASSSSIIYYYKLWQNYLNTKEGKIHFYQLLPQVIFSFINFIIFIKTKNILEWI